MWAPRSVTGHDTAINLFHIHGEEGQHAPPSAAKVGFAAPRILANI